MRLECEREQQDHLLLSVMPAYIAAELTGTTGPKRFITLNDYESCLMSSILQQLHSI